MAMPGTTLGLQVSPFAVIVELGRGDLVQAILSNCTRTFMKTFNVHLRDGRVVTVHAETYRHEGQQYVFDKSDSNEVQFFVDSEVTAIVEAIPPPMPVATPRRTRALDG